MKRFLLLLLLSVPVFLLAQSAMSLDDCIRLAYKQNPAVRNGVIGIKETKADYIASVGAFLPHIVVNAETGKRFGRSLDPDTNGYTSESFEEGTVGLDMTLSLFEGFSRINQVRFRKMNKERSEWELKEKQNELAYQVTDAYYKLILERKLLDLALEQSRLSERYLKQTEVFVELGLKSASDLQEVKARREGDIYRYQSRENSSRIALLHLKQLMNIQPGDTLAILDTITASQVPPYSVSTVETLYAQSIEILPSIRMIDLKQKAAHKEYAIAGGAFSPSVFARFTVGSNYYNTAFSARQLRDNIGKYVGVGISFPLLSGLQRLTNQRKLKLNMYRLKNEEELEKQQLYTDIEQTLLSLHTGYSEHQQALSQLDAETLVLKESERKWEEGLISVFQLMEARNRFIAAKAELVRVRLQIEMMMKLEKYYRLVTFLETIIDTLIERKPGINRKRLYWVGGVMLGLAVIAYFIFRDTASSMAVEKDRLTIATVEQAEFSDYIRVIGQVMPSRIIYMDAIEGGRVEERLKEEGAMVKAGDVILRLSNPLLNIGIMQSEADLAYQENELRNTRISMEQERLQLKQERIGLNKELIGKQRRYEQYKRLVNEQLIAREDYRQAEEEYIAAKEQLAVIDERIRQDHIFRESQIGSLDENIRNMKRSLALVRERLENLKVKAPIDGQVGNLNAQIGQSISAGEHIGQIITSDLKVQAQIDEHYVERVLPGLPADFTRDGGTYKLEVTKPYPEVKDGQFRTDLNFISERPENIRAGQTYHINLQLGDPAQAILVPRGGFFQITGGRWMYVVDESGTFATRRPVKIGRQNPLYYEVTDGLSPGEKVIISGYELFGDNEKLILK